MLKKRKCHALPTNQEGPDLKVFIGPTLQQTINTEFTLSLTIKMEVIPIWPFTSTQHTIKNRCLSLPAKEHRVFTYKQVWTIPISVYHSQYIRFRKRNKKKKTQAFWGKGIDEFVFHLEAHFWKFQTHKRSPKCWSWMMNTRVNYAIQFYIYLILSIIHSFKMHVWMCLSVFISKVAMQ